MKLGRGAVEDVLAVGQDEEAVAVALGLDQVVGREDDRRPLVGEPEDELPEALALARIEPGGRLVEEEDGGRGEQADRDVHPLLVSARERADLIRAAVAKARLVEHPLDRVLDVVRFLEPGEQPQVLLDREPPVERRLLRDPADLAGNADGARVRIADAGEDREERRLARAVGPDHGEELARRGREARRRGEPRGRRTHGRRPETSSTGVAGASVAEPLMAPRTLDDGSASR